MRKISESYKILRYVDKIRHCDLETYRDGYTRIFMNNYSFGIFRGNIYLKTSHVLIGESVMDFKIYRRVK